MKTTKIIKLNADQAELLLEIVASAKIEANFASQKRHVMFLPDLFKKQSEYEKELASLQELLKISLEE